jgi:pimeloyl-ACP methyl ester carboxylesterase
VFYLALLLTLIVSFACSSDEAPAVREVSFAPSDGGMIFANLYGSGDHAVILAHGMVFDKESWDVQARRLAKEGYRVLAADFRGYGKSTGEDKAYHEDILGAIRYLHEQGAKRISVIGGSMGGGAAAEAAVRTDAIDRLILLAPAPIDDPGKMKASKILFVVSKTERIAPKVREQFERAPKPARLEVFEGNAHAQHLFKTGQGEALMSLILSFLAD